MPWKSAGKARYVGRCETGCVYEETIELRDPQSGRTTNLRRIAVRLNTATRDGDQEIHLLTNLPAKVSGERSTRSFLPSSVFGFPIRS